MKKQQFLKILIAISTIPALGSCDIFDAINLSYQDQNEGVSGYSDSLQVKSSPSHYTVEGSAYDKVDSRHIYRNVGNVIDTHYIPSSGSPKMLVIPVKVSDYAENANSTNLSYIKAAFTGDSTTTNWESVKSFYKKSSFGNLDLDITVADEWYDCGLSTKQISNMSTTSDSVNGAKYVIKKATEWYKSKHKLSGKRFDSDGDGYIDAVWCIYSAPDYAQDSSVDDVFWAYTSWMNEDADKSYPSVNTFAWASYDFARVIYSYEKEGDFLPDAHTYIHETGHMLGLDDYYSYDYDGSSPVGRLDMMDNNILDNDVFSKYALGWIKPYLVDKKGSITIKPSESSGDALLIPSGNWNGSCFDEYIMVEYYTPTGLNEKDSTYNYGTTYPLGFTESGAKVYHVDARLAKYSYSSRGSSFSYTDDIVSTSTSASILAHTNTASSGYNYLNDEYNLIQLMDCTNRNNFGSSHKEEGKTTLWCADNSSLFRDRDTFTVASYRDSYQNASQMNPNRMNDGSDWNYTLTFSNMSDEGITVTIS